MTESSKETKFKATLFGAKRNVYTFALGTPGNPEGKSLDPKENERRCKQFEQQLKELRLYSYRGKGRYNSEEASYLIVNINLSQCIYFFGKSMFNQESFIYARVNNKDNKIEYSYYKISDRGDKFELRGTQTVVRALNKDTLDYYTQYKNFKFNIPFEPEVLEEALCEVSEVIDRSLGSNEDYRDILKHVALSEGYTLKHYWEFNTRYLTPRSLRPLNELIAHYKKRHLPGVIEGMNLEG